ncbi:uncharacterized protein LOC135221405 [Macrobrachium nipponense]|uniref:uncharacterized protein LOC135221405 n=1 Tax=Macrobrachium nipponense TaxID=159736 RepID=UPI0030C7B1C1
MTTTTTFGVGIGAAALAGAASLGLAGLAVAAFHGKRRRGRKGHGYRHGYGHHGGGGGHGYGYHGRKRRRSVEEEEETRERILELIREEDVLDCGMRLVCELGGNDEDELSMEELAILSLVGPVVQPGEGILPGRASAAYRIARTAGYSQTNCTELYSKCPVDNKNLVEAVMSYIP